MSWQRAPLYVEAHDLAAWLEGRFDGERPSGLERELARAGRELLVALSCALAFPAAREQHLAAADELALRLRVLLRLACEAGRLAPRPLRFAAARLERIGRMLGGWRRDRRLGAARAERPEHEHRETRSGARRTRGASSAAAPTGTTPSTAAPPTATGTTPTTTSTTTTASASSSRRPAPSPQAADEPDSPHAASRPRSGGPGSARARPRLPVAPARAPGSGEAPPRAT